LIAHCLQTCSTETLESTKLTADTSSGKFLLQGGEGMKRNLYTIPGYITQPGIVLLANSTWWWGGREAISAERFSF
jgi:hypothetical protein